MPLFGSSHRDNTVDTSNTSHSPTRTGTLHKGRDVDNAHSPTSATHKKGGLFSRDRRSTDSFSSSDREDRGSHRTGTMNSTTNTSTGGGFFGLGNRNKHHLDDDPSIRNARQTIADAENAEKEADRALVEARNRTRLAREHIKVLEREAEEDARRAKAKAAEARVINKSAKGLGRHGH
ncbi:hypothetical protein CPB83DRAFT_907704 [Crepidotus variabilis]|uniref:Uncharacterized protein n=1 Tax=Crepidotus variabilis TaxID=179855 RepID=A0A9P6EE79_9AGAR|nr:hypothetical protein CPB83DRAFT_907704 [Crepidotus variabilis]